MTTFCVIPSKDDRFDRLHPRQYTCDANCKPVAVLDPDGPEDALTPLLAMGSVENVRDVLRVIAAPKSCPKCGRA